MDTSNLMEYFSYAVVGLLLATVAWSHWKREKNLQPVSGRKPPYMVDGIDFTQFPRREGQVKMINWIRDKYKELGNARPTTALCEEKIVKYHELYGHKPPTIAEFRASNRA